LIRHKEKRMAQHLSFYWDDGTPTAGMAKGAIQAVIAASVEAPIKRGFRATSPSR
jgi:hypothetical protein